MKDPDRWKSTKRWAYYRPTMAIDLTKAAQRVMDIARGKVCRECGRKFLVQTGDRKPASCINCGGSKLLAEAPK